MNCRLTKLLVSCLGLALFACLCCVTGCKKKSTPPALAQQEGSEVVEPKTDGPGSESASADVESADFSDGSEPNEANEASEVASTASEEFRDPLATEGTWTTKRLIALTPTGPALVDLSISIAGQSLEEAAQSTYARLGAEAMEGLEEPVTWDSFLAQPLVQSGWIGNLIAEEEQTEQLVGMYDSDSDGEVDEEELAAFFSRGLARNDAIFVTDEGAAPNAIAGSPWGKSDEDEDYSLTVEELQAMPQVLGQKDFDGDSILTAGELDLRQDAEDGAMSRSFVQTDSLLSISQPAKEAKESERQSQQRRRRSRELLQFYTYLEGVPREQWRSWSDERWAELDHNGDQLLERREIESIFELEADCRLAIRFPPLVEGVSEEPLEGGRLPGMMRGPSAQEQTRVWVTFRNIASDHQPADEEVSHELEQRWGSKTGPLPSGQLAVAGLVANLVVDDSYTQQSQRALKQQLSTALKQPQLREFFIRQFQLQEDAFALLDANEDQKLSDEEFRRVWSWLSARQGTRILGRWTTAPAPWFQLLDQNADDRITPREMDFGQTLILGLDHNGDQMLTPDELPLLVRFELRRLDNRLDRNFFGLPPDSGGPQVDQDWFAAMDTNRDGYINRTEFLGQKEDFLALDQDQDGFLHRSEVYNSPASE